MDKFVILEINKAVLLPLKHFLVFSFLVSMPIIGFCQLGDESKFPSYFGIYARAVFPSNAIGNAPITVSKNGFTSTISQNLGYSFGGTVRAGITKLISFETGINFTQRNFSIQMDLVDSSITGTNTGDWALFVCNASGVQWLTRASVLEISATGAEAINTIATYWKCTANSGWFNLSNWFSDQYVTTALSYPNTSTNVVMSGDCAAYVNMDCNLWVQPNSIDTTRVTDTDGVCLYSNATKSFYTNIYGNVAMYGKLDGKANMENKYDFPPPVDTKLFFGACALVATTTSSSKEQVLHNLSIELWEKMYEKLFGGFENLALTVVEDEEEEDELAAIPASKKTKKGGYLKDGFVVDTESSSDHSGSGSSSGSDDDSEDDLVDSEETSDPDTPLLLEDIGSELSEEAYDYSSSEDEADKK